MNILNIPSAELCRLLSLSKSELTILENAIRDLIESMYSADEIEIMRQRACLRKDVETPIAQVKKINAL